MMKKIYVAELNRNASPIPQIAIIQPPMAGPTTRAKLKMAELSATAEGTSSLRTKLGTTDSLAAVFIDQTMPKKADQPTNQ
jgi:hypothetical protein